MARPQPVRRKAQAKAPVSIPDKLYFRIGDVARLCSLPAYVLRFWETEFPQLKPNKGGTGQRLYRKRDVEMVLEIKRLLYDEGFTIAGARRLLAEKRRAVPAAAAKPIQISSDRNHQRAGQDAVLTAKQQPSKLARNRPEISAIRKEMRELLMLLGPTPSVREASISPVKRGTKKAARADEPTLF